LNEGLIPSVFTYAKVDKSAIDLGGRVKVEYQNLDPPFLVSMVAACFIKKIIDIAETKNVKVDSLVAEVGAFARPEDVINGVARLSKFKILVKTTVDIPEDIINEAKKKCAAYSTLSTCVDFEVTFIKVSTLT